jgi:DnaA family protein
LKQIPLSLGAAPTLSFDNFLPGANSAVLAHLHALQAGAPPVFLWGPQGSGKTHLLRALGLSWQQRGGQVGWYDMHAPLPWIVNENQSLLLLDDCDRFDVDRQQAAFALFVEAATLGLSIVATGALPPIDLTLREDLRTRLAWGLIFNLQPLGDAEMRAALRREADRRGIFLSDDVMDYLLTRFARDLKNLMRLLDQLDEFALSHKRGVTVPLLKQMLADAGTSRP